MPPPVIRTPFTDLLPAGYSHQFYGRCMKFEDRFLQCSEAYGAKLSEEKCLDYKNDLYECNSFEKQVSIIVRRFIVFVQLLRCEVFTTEGENYLSCG